MNDFRAKVFQGSLVGVTLHDSNSVRCTCECSEITHCNLDEG